MNMPGFTAESSVGNTSENYKALGIGYEGASLSQVIPQIERRCFCGDDWCYCVPPGSPGVYIHGKPVHILPS